MMQKIVIAGTLKPVSDVRAYEKIAQSLAKTNKYEVNIIGNEGKKEANSPLIHFHPFKLSKDNIVKRILLPIKAFGRIARIRPLILIITSHELLWVAMLTKALYHSRIIYDVQEDYRKNLRYLSGLSSPRKVLAWWIRIKEMITASFVDQFWLAEKCYQTDLTFVQSKSIVLENKASELSIRTRTATPFIVLFSGTISRYSEILLAIRCFQELKEIIEHPKMEIVGQIHDKQLWKELQSLSDKDPSINLNVSAEIVPHATILDAIQSASLGIISYQLNPVNEHKVPTKLYEYSRYRLPYLVQQQTHWEEKSRGLGGAIPIDFQAPDLHFIHSKLKDPDRLFPDPYPKTEAWEAQEPQLFDSINALIGLYQKR